MKTSTPITDAEERKPAFSPSEWIKLTRRLELAANALEEALLDIVEGYQITNPGAPANLALNAFAALKPKGAR